MQPSAADLLGLARDLVARGWTQCAEGRAPGGAPVDPWLSTAASWSLLGAIVAAYENYDRSETGFPLDELAVALHRLAEFVEDDSLAHWNDEPGRTQQDVFDVLTWAEASHLPAPPAGGARH